MNEPFLTTVTPCWGREEVVKDWISNLWYLQRPWLKHIVIFVGSFVHYSARNLVFNNPNFQLIVKPDDIPGDFSIGHYHNEGFQMAQTEWVMKLDVDAFPNEKYFDNLFPILQSASPREWFNGGMLHLKQGVGFGLPLSAEEYSHLMRSREACSESPHMPVGSNFICRRKEYLQLGGCCEQFRGYGWEDYQQLYMLERYRLQAEPLSDVTLANVTQKCRDDISRPLAKSLWFRNEWLCLLHRWHPVERTGTYRSALQLRKNKETLYHYIRNEL